MEHITVFLPDSAVMRMERKTETGISVKSHIQIASNRDPEIESNGKQLHRVFFVFFLGESKRTNDKISTCE